jgi:hypothetical protein
MCLPVALRTPQRPHRRMLRRPRGARDRQHKIIVPPFPPIPNVLFARLGNIHLQIQQLLDQDGRERQRLGHGESASLTTTVQDDSISTA